MTLDDLRDALGELAGTDVIPTPAARDAIGRRVTHAPPCSHATLPRFSHCPPCRPPHRTTTIRTRVSSWRRLLETNLPVTTWVPRSPGRASLRPAATSYQERAGR
jgi:hypothetical protein